MLLWRSLRVTLGDLFHLFGPCDRCCQNCLYRLYNQTFCTLRDIDKDGLVYLLEGSILSLRKRKSHF